MMTVVCWWEIGERFQTGFIQACGLVAGTFSASGLKVALFATASVGSLLLLPAQVREPHFDSNGHFFLKLLIYSSVSSFEGFDLLCLVLYRIIIHMIHCYYNMYVKFKNK